MDTTAGTPRSLLARLVAVLCSLVVSLELAHLWAPVIEAEARRPPGWPLVEAALVRYAPVRAWVTGNANSWSCSMAKGSSPRSC